MHQESMNSNFIDCVIYNNEKIGTIEYYSATYHNSVRIHVVGDIEDWSIDCMGHNLKNIKPFSIDEIKVENICTKLLYIRMFSFDDEKILNVVYDNCNIEAFSDRFVDDNDIIRPNCNRIE